MTAKVHPFHHPGAGRRKAALHPKGRQLDPAALDDVRALLGDRPRRRDLLIEHLHLIQDAHGCLAARHLVALAEEMRLALAEVYEVATFYAHFDVMREDDATVPTVTVRVCDSLTCEMLGAQDLLAALPKALGPNVRVVRAPCMGACDRAPNVAVGHAPVHHATPARVATALADHDVPLPAYPGLGDYTALAACRDGTHSVDDVIGAIEAAGLRGKGGAGFLAAQKWRFVRAEPGPRTLAINADEGEPGTFKDRMYLEEQPHRFLEGMLIAAWAIEAERSVIYLRDEYPAAYEILEREIAALEEAGLVPRGHIDLRRGAGAYICGEESAMLESIEGKRGLPRHRPPYVAQVGLFGHPTLVHNVETVSWLPTILNEGPQAYAAHGRRGRQGLHAFSVSGRVAEPGVKLAPAGITVRELIDEHCGGMDEGHILKAYLPGGASGGILPASLADEPLDFGTLDEYGCFIGSGAVIVLSQADSVAAVALNLMRFFADESCGQCTPCRVGTEKAVKLMEADEWDEALLTELSATMRDASICGLGQAAPNPLDCLRRFFPEDVPGKVAY